MIGVEVDWKSQAEMYTKPALPYQGGQTKPLLISDPEYCRALNIDYGIENSTVRVVLSNHGRFFTDKMTTSDRFIIGKQISIVDLDANTTIYTGAVSDFPETKENQFEIKADTYTLINLQANEVLKNDVFPNIPPQNEGKWGNTILGKPTGKFQATRIDQESFLAAWNPLSLVYDIVDKNNNPLSATKYIDPATNYTYINCSNSDDYIKFKAEGGDTNGIISNPIEMLNYLLSLFSNLQIEDMNDTKIIFQNRQYLDNSLFVTGKTKLIDIFKDFARSYNCRILPARTGNIKIKALKYGGETPVLKLDEQRMKDFCFWLETKLVASRFIRYYQYDSVEREFLRTPQDIETHEKWNDEIGEIRQKFISTDVVSWDSASREAHIRQKPIYVYSFYIPNGESGLLELGDSIEVQHYKGPFPGCRLAQVLREERKKNTGFSKIECIDVSEIKGKTMILQEPGHSEAVILREPGNPDNPMLWWTN
jgi:hypothetical protein